MGPEHVLSIDLETYSEVDLVNCGLYRYVDDPSFEILLCSYAVDDGPVITIDLACGEELSEEFLSMLENPAYEIHAFNAAFERVCLSKYVGHTIDPEYWWDTQSHAAMYGLPASLKDVAKVLQLSEQKDTAGVFLINYFSKPCKPTDKNGQRTRNYPVHDMDKWNLYVKYNKQDVETERAISRFLDTHYPADGLEREKWIYRNTERVNDNGVLIDQDLCKAIVEYNDSYYDQQLARAKEITGLENPNSLSQLKPWLQSKGLIVTSITKETLPQLIEQANDLRVKEVLQIRKNLSLTSVTKFQKMLDCVCSDGRIHGVMKHYGASRTGRFAGRLLQTQNLKRNNLPELAQVRELVKARDWEYLEMMYEDDLQDVFGQLTRTAIIAPEGMTLTIADYSAIEARVISWIAHEDWANEVFAGDGKIYEATAAQMFGVPIETIAKGKENYELRQRGKVASLACGYGGGAKAMEAMDVAHKIDPKDYPKLVKMWRKANPNIVKFWTIVGDAAVQAIYDKTTVKHENLTFMYKDNCLFIQIPSGRWLTYFNARLDEEGNIEYYGVDTKGWSKLRTYSGKLVENIVQATARDCLTDSLLNLEIFGFRIIFHVHDEIITETEDNDKWLKVQTRLMSKNNDTWDTGLLHPAPGFQSKYYLKD